MLKLLKRLELLKILKLLIMLSYQIFNRLNIIGNNERNII